MRLLGWVIGGDQMLFVTMECLKQAFVAAAAVGLAAVELPESHALCISASRAPVLTCAAPLTSLYLSQVPGN